MSNLHQSPPKYTNSGSVPILFDNPREALPSLQLKVLRHICTTPNASYETLTHETNRHRITVLHSLKSLIRDRYVKEQKIDPKYAKSKLVFVPTLKGLSFAWFNWKLKINDMVLPSDNQIANYIQYVKEAFGNLQQQLLLELLFNQFEHRDQEFENVSETTRSEVIKDCFCRGLLELVRQNDYSAKRLGSKASMKRLNRIFSSEELGEIKKLLTLTRDNLTITIQQFPV
jgi:hypothetical protein